MVKLPRDDRASDPQGQDESLRPIIVVPFLGGLSDFALLSLKMLGANAPHADIALISDRDLPEIAGISSYRIEDVYDEANPLGISLKALKANPYKLCDLKPFFSLVFPRLVVPYRRWGYGDVDCLYSDSVLAKPASFHQDGLPQVFGQYGHLTIGDREAFQEAQKVLLACAAEHLEFHILDAKRHVAVDEFLFLHVVWRALEASGKVRWVRDFPGAIGDVEPFYRRPFIAGRFYSAFSVRDGRAFGRTLAGEEVEFDYIHLQKRRVEIDPALSRTGELPGAFDALPLADGGLRLQPSGPQRKQERRTDQLADLVYLLQANRKRIAGRLQNHGFGRRPKLSPGLVQKAIEQGSHVRM